MSPGDRPPTVVVLVESGLGVALVLCGLMLAIFTSHWMTAFWLVTVCSDPGSVESWFWSQAVWLVVWWSFSYSAGVRIPK